MRLKRLRLFRSEEGDSLVEAGLFVPMLLLLLMGVVDFGRAYYLADEIAGAAQAGAVYGTQNSSDTTGMSNAAKLNAPDVSGLTATGAWGCECSDGTHVTANCTSTPTCSVNVVYYAKVTASATYHPMIPWPGISSSTISRSVTMRSTGN
ncbi:MAG: TadE/TadG family type IV pilus assembly protein [Terracidiphilus sp.]|jgi:Flp pilus assembly protein TadG